MRLLWVHYKSNTKHGYILCLELGRLNGKIYVIDTKTIDPSSRNIIITNKTKLNNLSLDGKIKWLKKNCPNAMKAFKTLYESKSTIVKIYQLE